MKGSLLAEGPLWLGLKRASSPLRGEKMGVESRFGPAFLKGISLPNKQSTRALFGNLGPISIVWWPTGRNHSPGHRPSKGGHAKITKLPGFEVRPTEEPASFLL